MISLERLVELRSDYALVERLKRTCEAAAALVAVDIVAISKKVANGEAAPEVRESGDGAAAMLLAVYEEARRPLIELLRDIDTSAVVRARPHLHARLKELLKGTA